MQEALPTVAAPSRQESQHHDEPGSTSGREEVLSGLFSADRPALTGHEPIDLIFALYPAMMSDVVLELLSNVTGGRVQGRPTVG